MSIFDPLGLLSPILVTGKAFIRKIAKAHPGWDEITFCLLGKEWQRWIASITEPRPIVIPRFISTDNLTKVCGFADASLMAYGYAIYVYCGPEQGFLLCAKSKTIPVGRTIPDLELMAALMMIGKIKAMSIAIPQIATSWAIHCFLDSQVTLHRLARSVPFENLFVKRRVSALRDLSVGVTWSFCPGEINPADVVTRGATLNDLRHSISWWSGPNLTLIPDKLEIKINAVHASLPQTGILERAIKTYPS
jgi:Pao retrotransposon peptidase